MTTPMIRFRITEHFIREGVQVVEIVLADSVVGSITAVVHPDHPHQGQIRIISAHIADVQRDAGNVPFPIPSVEIVFRPRRYRITDDRITYLED